MEHGTLNEKGYRQRLDVLAATTGAETSDNVASAPHLLGSNGVCLLLVVLAVGLAAGKVERPLGLSAVSDGLVEALKDGPVGLLELGSPVESTTAGRGRAGLVHVVHAMLANERVERHESLLASLVEGLRRAVAVGAENVVLGLEHTLDTAHQATTLAVEVRVDLLLKGGLVDVTGANGDTHGHSLLQSLAGHVLVHGHTRVDARASEELGADGTARALGGAEDDIDVSGGDDASLLLVDNAEAVREVEGLALGAVLLEVLPSVKEEEFEYLRWANEEEMGRLTARSGRHH